MLPMLNFYQEVEFSFLPEKNKQFRAFFSFCHFKQFHQKRWFLIKKQRKQDNWGEKKIIKSKTVTLSLICSAFVTPQTINHLKQGWEKVFGWPNNHFIYRYTTRKYSEGHWLTTWLKLNINSIFFPQVFAIRSLIIFSHEYNHGTNCVSVWGS